MKSEKNLHFNYGISILRILSAIAVILIHACTTILDNEKVLFLVPDYQIEWFSIIEKICRWAVPVFIMITGNLFLNKSGEISYGVIFKKYIFRIFIALLIFGIPLAFLARLLDSDFNWSGLPDYIGQAFLDIIQGNGPPHLWYLYMLIGAYVAIPILKSFTEQYDIKQQLILAMCLYVCNYLFEFLNEALEIHIAFYVPFGYEIFYLLVGKNIVQIKYMIETKLKKSVTYILYISLLVMSLVAFVMMNDNGYKNPFIAVASVVLFILFSEIKIKNTKTQKILWSLDRLCFGVYVFHPLWIQFAYKVLKIAPQNCIELFLFTIIFAILSFITCVIARTIKPIRKIL